MPRLGLRRDLEVEPAFDQRRIARQRHTGHAETGSQVLERERRRRGHVAEGVLPGHRGARRQLHAGGEREIAGKARGNTIPPLCKLGLDG